MPNTKSYSAVVEKVIDKGKHGAYVVARTEDLGVVTFALDKDVWREEHQPEPGDRVLLSQVIQKRAGWRAKQARALNPSDTINQ